MKPYSKDLRLRVLSAVDSGKPREEVARTFSVSMPTIKRWLKRRRETGDVQPEPIPGRPPRKGAMLKEWLPEHLQANDDLTLEEHRQAFEEEFGQTISTSTVGRAIAGLRQGGWPLKGAGPAMQPSISATHPLALDSRIDSERRALATPLVRFYARLWKRPSEKLILALRYMSPLDTTTPASALL
jgi:transposase